MNREGRQGHEVVLARMRAWRLRAAAVVLGALCAGCRNAPPAQSGEVTTGQQREAAYRANNRGVALMEQDAFAGAARAFREAFTIEPGLRLARINLPIALYYAGQLREAAQAATDVRRDLPDAPQPSYVLGLIARAQSQPQAAADAFTRVLALDPSDVGSRLNLAMIRLAQGQYQDVATLCRAVLTEEPYNATAAYNLALALDRAGDRAGGAQAMRRFEQLRTEPYAVTYSQAYLEQGRYAEALASTGVERDLVDAAPPAVTFVDATAVLLPGGAVPGSPALADIDGDGRLDLVVAGGSLQAFHNDGARLVDVTAALGLAAAPGAAGIVAADVDNDGRIDLLVMTASGPRLLIRQDDGRYRDATPRVFSNARTPKPGAAALADVDHDGDLDVLAGGRLLRNNGNGTFADGTTGARLRLPREATVILPTDFDNRRDVDVLTAAYGARPALFRNLRTGSFVDIAATTGLPVVDDVSTIAAGDVNKDGFPDLFFGRSDAPGLWALSDGRGRFQTRDAPAGMAGALAAQLLDYDNDGLLDLITAARDGLHLFRNTGGDWQPAENALAASRHGRIADSAVPSIASGDLDGDGDIDLVVNDGGAVHVWRNDGGNAHRALRVALAGRASNRNGVGAKIEVRAGSLYTRIETAATTPATMPADTLLGLGQRAQADAIRVLWPSGILQTETPSAGGRTAIAELDRKPSSCPFLYAWDGERFTFVTDFMGGGEMGYLESPGLYNEPDPDEYVRLTDGQLKERNGRYELRVTNELEEALYVDHLKLMAVTHYADVQIFPDEGMRLHPAPFRLHTVRNLRPLAEATDDQGRDILPDLSSVDRRFATGFPLEAVRGYAKPHGVTMRLPPLAHRSQAGIGGRGSGIRDPGPRIRSAGARTVLLLTGWTDYAFSTDNVAATQSALTLTPPALEARGADGTWRTVNADVGIPIGRPQTLVLDVTDYAMQPLRLVTSMRVYWDRIAVADLDAVQPRPVVLAPRATELHWRGFSAEVSPDGREPYGYDYARATGDSPWKLMPGRYTREGDVRELLQGVDDRFVISRPGDEITLSFDASALPPLSPGMRRTFLLYASGYSKEMDLHSASPDAVAPIPFRAMPHYPYAWPVRYPHDADMNQFHTRVIGRAVPALLTSPTER
jgi:tetratricopeptide (TPR) repeat protein